MIHLQTHIPYNPETKLVTFKQMFDDDFKHLIKIKEGDLFGFDKWSERSVGFHRRFFKLLLVSIHHFNENIDEKFNNIDYLRACLMLLIGHSDIINIPGRGMQEVPKSISFKNCSQETFEDVYSKSFDALLKYFLHGISQQDFERGLINFM